MNLRLIAELVRIRYKLMWARTRTRNGKIALFLAGYLLLLLIVGLLGAGGVGTAIIAVRSGEALKVTQIVLTSLFFQALLATVMLGFGISAIFSDLELRRYPVNAVERRVAGHLIGILDPFWLLTISLDFGLVIGIYALGAGSFWIGAVAALGLVIANYLAARVLESIVNGLMKRRSGTMILTALVALLSLSGGIVPSLLKSHPEIASAAVRVLAFTPPFGAAAAITGSGMAAVYGLAIVVWWSIGLIAALVWLERRPAATRAPESGKLQFDSRYDRVATVLGFEHAPLVGWWLRFYARNNRFKALLVITVPMLAFLTYNLGGRKGGVGLFPAAMGVFPIATFLSTARFMVNEFGYLGGGYRRCFLLPVEPAAVLRTGSYASMLLSAWAIPAGAIAWIALSPMPFDARQVLMLLSNACAGLFLFHGLGLWASIFGARRGKYDQSMGNDLSLVGNIVVIGGVLTCLFGTMFLHRSAPGIFDPSFWWIWLAAPLLTCGFYAVSLRATAALLPARREQLMAIVEGRA